MRRALLILLAFAVTSLAAYGGWALHARPQPMPDVPDGKLRCVSYAPYRDGQSPFMQGLVIPAWQIEEDLAILSKRFDCVRTYSINQGLAEVPRIAAKHGMRVLLGVWITRDRDKKLINEKEIEVAVGLANQPEIKDTIMAVVVGNEVLLRREQTADQMIGWINSVKNRVSVPVTYADVWEFWVKNPAVAAAVDYMTIHILPYWEDEPQPIDKAIAHLREILVLMRREFPGKTLFIGETGWPSAGRSREGAVPSRVNQARYIREFVAAVSQEKIDYNVIESFDQPWKRVLEGTVGGHWGLFSADRQQKFPFIGPVGENPGWRMAALTGMAIALALLATLAWGGFAFGPLGWLIAAVAAQACGIILVRQWQFIADTSHNIGTWLASFAALTLSAASTLLLFQAIAGLVAGRGATLQRPASAAQALGWVRRPRLSALNRDMMLGLVRFLALFGATTLALQLLLDGRYRDFPISGYLIPAAGFALLAWLRRRDVAADDERPVEEIWLSWLLAGAALIGALSEGFAHWESPAWMATALLMAAPGVSQWFRRRHAAAVRPAEA